MGKEGQREETRKRKSQRCQTFRTRRVKAPNARNNTRQGEPSCSKGMHLIDSGIVRAYTNPQSVVNGEIAEITNKIEALDEIRAKLEQKLLKLQEDDLELDDECVSINTSSCMFQCSLCLV